MKKVMAHALTQSSSATSSIVPVLISTVEEPQREVLTYALLDMQSDSTFILEDLLDDLNAITQPVQLRLSTMTAVDTITAIKRVRGLQVRGLQGANSINLQQAYTRDFIPVDKSYIPIKRTELQWPHLKHLANQLPPLQNSEVGLLIRYDCPSAPAPLKCHNRWWKWTICTKNWAWLEYYRLLQSTPRETGKSELCLKSCS